MKPGFALSLSFEGISLLQRAAGGWRSIGAVPLESTDLAGDLAALRDKAVALGSAEMRCKVIIPNDQVRYLSIDTASFSGDARTAMVHQALDDATPYPVDSLAFDISLDGSITHVAAVARETLAEAEAFAVDHGFNPLSLVAAPGENPFLGEPFFGPAAHAATLPGASEVEPDGIAVVVIGPADVAAKEDSPDFAPESGSESESEPGPETKPPSSPAETEPAPVAAGFSSRRLRKPADGKTANDGETDPELPEPPAFKSIQTARPGATEPEPEPEPVSVIAPNLDIPESTEPGSTDEAAHGAGAFLSRRRKTERAEEPAAPARAPVPPAPAPLADREPSSAPVLTAASRPASHPGFVSATPAKTAADEAARMTVFGARAQASVGGKPRHLGLMLSAALLVFLAGVAAWASVFLDDGIAGLFRESPPQTELAAVPDTPGIGVKADDPISPQPAPTTATAPAPAEPAPTPQQPTDLALVSPGEDADLSDLPAPRRVDPPAQPVSPDLSETDTAVLEALRQPPQGDDPPAQTIEPEPQGEAAESEPAPEPAPALVASDMLQIAPQMPDTPSIIGLDDLYVASIDRTDLSQDAVALPSVASLNTDLPPGTITSPVAAGTAFQLGPRGLVVASVEGTLNPDGVMVYLGRPASVPPAVPTRFETQPETDAEIDRLAGLRPHLRPNDLEERFERSNLGGLTHDELGGLRPRARPESQQQEVEPDAPPTAQAVVSSRLPKARPGNFSAIVSAAVRPPTVSTPSNGGGSAREQVATVAPRTVKPKIPSSASVARQATLKNEINLRRVNLIGVYGSPSNRRALVRLPSGRYKKVKVGDTMDGGRVVAIGDSELRYQKSGRNLTLKIPSS